MSRKKLEDRVNTAAAYVHRRTGYHHHAISKQMNAKRRYAKRRGLDIAMGHSDEDKSGGNTQGSDAKP